MEDLPGGGTAFIQCVAVAFIGAVPLLLETPRELDELRPPSVLRTDRGDVLPVRAPFAVVQDVRAVQRDEHRVVPGPDCFAQTAGGGELRGVALPLVRAAR